MKVPEKHRAIAHLAVDGAEIEWFNQFIERWEPKEHDHWSKHIQYRVKQTPHSIDWSHVHKKYVALVQFANGQILLLDKVPEMRRHEVYRQALTSYAIPEDFASFKRGTIDWKDSLVLRHTEAPKTLTKEQWAKIPAEFNFAAADSDGEWYAFITEPKKHKSFWDAKDDLWHLLEPDDVGTLPDVPWEDSLCKRP